MSIIEHPNSIKKRNQFPPFQPVELAVGWAYPKKAVYNYYMFIQKSPPLFTWLLFDADNTLFDYEAAEDQALKGVFSFFDLPFRLEYGHIYAGINHSYWQRFEAGTINLADLRINRFRDFLAEINIPLDANLFSAQYLHHLGQSAILFPGVVETLTELAALHKMAIITNGISAVQRSRLSLSPIQPFFDHLFISEEIGISKPAEGYFAHVFQQLNHPARTSVLVIGDSLSSDISGGAAYGLSTCWYNPAGLPNYSGIIPTYQISTLPELVDICLPGHNNKND